MSTTAPVARRPFDLLGAVAATEHKSIARRLAVVSFAFFVIGGLLAMVIRVQLAAPNTGLLGTNTYTSQVDFLRAAAFLVPVVVFAATFHVCRRLVACDLHPLRGRTGTRILRRTPEGGFAEVEAGSGKALDNA